MFTNLPQIGRDELMARRIRPSLSCRCNRNSNDIHGPFRSRHLGSRPRRLAAKNWREHEIPFRSSVGRGLVCELQRGECRGRMRPWLASRSVWRLPAQSRRRLRCPAPGSCCAPGRGGAARSPRLPLWFRLGLRTLPPGLILPISDTERPRLGGTFHWPRQRQGYLQLSLPLTNSSVLPPIGRRQTYHPLAPAGICCEQEIVTGPSAALNVQSTLQVTPRSPALSVLMITASFAGDIAQE